MIINDTYLIADDHKHVWHPCSQMKDYEEFKPLVIDKARGSYLYLKSGQRIIDAISSWWCKSLGHNHPRLNQALIDQLARFEHVILANTTHDTVVDCSKRLSRLTSLLDKVFYASDGSCAVEVALKMSLHARQILGQTQRCTIMALENGYHGETCLALSVSDVGLYKDPYKAFLTATHFLTGIPYVAGMQDPLWHDCSEVWPNLEKQLNAVADQLTAVIVEPIVQGAGGMRIYSQDFLRRLRAWTSKHDIHLIADEIMTGLGRTGYPLACEHAKIEPDFVCLSKGLTSGYLPLSAVLTSSDIYQLFYDDYERGKSFLHSHTYCGNALALAVANTVLQVMDEDNIYSQVRHNQPFLQQLMLEVADRTGKLHNIRSIGGMVAGDLRVDISTPRAGYAVYRRAVELGALLRPLGNTIYWLPPLNTPDTVLRELQRVTIQAINEAF